MASYRHNMIFFYFAIWEENEEGGAVVAGIFWGSVGVTNIILRDESSREEETQSESSAQTWIFHNPEFRVLYASWLEKKYLEKIEL